MSFFQKDAPVWQPLNDLKGFMDNYHYATYDDFDAPCVLRSGVPLTEHLVLHKGRSFCLNEIVITFGDATRGELKVTRNGVELEGASVVMAGSVLVGEKISIGRGVLIESGAMIKSPTIIGDHAEIRQGAYIRGYCLLGSRCVVGHTTEVKHSIFLEDAKAGHFAYLGDSILGNNANLGAGTKFANLRFLQGNVKIPYLNEKLDTGRRKFGAILGDDAQTGCNSVTNPGTLMAKKTILLPNTTAKAGFYPEKSIIR
ncbi:acyltransferase [Desulforhopalus singaporensis]|nr:hypothetical protein [Desulforhopalus singaporensis]